MVVTSRFTVKKRMTRVDTIDFLLYRLQDARRSIHKHKLQEGNWAKTIGKQVADKRCLQGRGPVVSFGCLELIVTPVFHVNFRFLWWNFKNDSSDLNHMESGETYDCMWWCPVSSRRCEEDNESEGHEGKHWIGLLAYRCKWICKVFASSTTFRTSWLHWQLWMLHVAFLLE